MNMNLDTQDKLDFEELIKDFRIQSLENLTSYLRQIWTDLWRISDHKSKGLDKITFSKFYELPGPIVDRLFSVLDKNNDGNLDSIEFTLGIASIFTGSFNDLTKLIFNMYDFDNDGLISKEDIRILLSYVSLNKDIHKSLKLKNEYGEFNEEYNDRVESQVELHQIIEKAFNNNLLQLDYNLFKNVIETNCSEIFLFLLIFMIEKRPFSKEWINNYKNIKKPTHLGIKSNVVDDFISKSPKNSKILISSPRVDSKFSPSVFISKSPTVIKSNTLEIKNFEGNVSTTNKSPTNHKLLKYAINTQNHVNEKKIDKTFERSKTKKTDDFSNIIKNLSLDKSAASPKAAKPTLKIVINNEDEDTSDHENDDFNNVSKMEGYLYKISKISNKMNKLWCSLIHRDLYYYKNKTDEVYKGMRNFTGVFVNEEASLIIEGVQYYCFACVYPKKVRHYYTETQEECKKWIDTLRKSNGYKDIAEIYEMKEQLGRGKFGLVKLGIHKKNKRKVAIKIINKKEMQPDDFERNKNEMEILKICQHPNIIRLYDILEDDQSYYLIMEYFPGEDLLSYFENRKFTLPEKRVAEIINKLATAIYYLQSYGIIHRDLKLDNILMTDKTDKADIRLLDFGLSRIVGPNQLCNEPYGSLYFVSPEILQNKPYDKSVDLWTLGVITYFLLIGLLPFDDVNSNEDEIAKKIIHNKVSYAHPKFKKYSKEAVQFIEGLLETDPKKRMDIKQVLEHSWIINNCSSENLQYRIKNVNEAAEFKIYSSPNL